MATSDVSSTHLQKLSCLSTVKFKKLLPKFTPSDTYRPKGRSGHCMCADEANLYVFGGYSPMDERNGVLSSRVLPELWKFNFASQKWSKISSSNTPHTCASACIAVQHNQVFVFGGTGYPFGQSMSNTIKTLRLNQLHNLSAAGEDSGEEVKQNFRWQLLETSAMSYSCGWEEEDVCPRPAYGQSLIFLKDSVYVFGGAIGYYSEAVSDLHKLNIHTMAWEKLRPTGKIPSGRYKQEVVKDDERLYVLGGGRLHHAEGLDKIYIYDTTHNHWTEALSLADPVHGYPSPRCSFGCAQDGKNVYISGGRHYNLTVDHKSLSDVWHLGLSTLQWTKLQMKLPKPLYFHSSEVSPAGHMYVFGGVHTDNFRAPYLYAVRLPLTLPKLSELCWDKVCKMARKCNILTPSGLTELGVPWNFIDRVQLPPL
ncbi:Kelch domain-containing protein 10 [Mactra antiquata]